MRQDKRLELRVWFILRICYDGFQLFFDSSPRLMHLKDEYKSTNDKIEGAVKKKNLKPGDKI